MKRKILFGFLLISLQSFMVGGGTMAYFTSEASLASTSAFEFSTVDIGIVEVIQDDQQAVWTITNTGGQDVKLRVLVTGGFANNANSSMDIEETEKLTDGADITGEPSVPPTVFLTPGEGWTFDGSYYNYTGTLPVNGSVPFSLTLTKEGGSPGTYTYNLDIEAQALQTVNDPKWEDIISF